MSLIGSTSFGFAQNTIHDFQKNAELLIYLNKKNQSVENSAVAFVK